MSSARVNEAVGLSSVEITQHPEGLAALHKAGCAAAIWERAPLPRFQKWIDTIPVDQLPRVRTTLQPGAVRRAIYELCAFSGLPDCAERALFIDDVAAMADIFADLMQTPYLRLRLDAINTNACRKFHCDAVTARLVCTYRGAGTQYGVAADGRDVEDIHSVGTGSPLLLRGTLWPVAPASGLLHRSPPIEGTGQTRLVLVLDPVEDVAADAARHFAHATHTVSWREI